MWDMGVSFDNHIQYVCDLLRSEGILAISGAPFFRTIQLCLNTSKQHFVNSQALLGGFLTFF